MGIRFLIFVILLSVTLPAPVDAQQIYDVVILGGRVIDPETGRDALFVNQAVTVRFQDMSEAESRPLLDYLFRHLERPEFTCRFRWRKGSVALWDNRCTQHRALNDYPGQRRAMRRVLVAGDRPFHQGD